jgi:hypothetical protein
LIYLSSLLLREKCNTFVKEAKHSASFECKLPPKKIRPSNDFLSKRQNELQRYLEELIEFYQNKYPMRLCDFLHFYKYEPNGLVHQLNNLLDKQPSLKFNSLHLNALHVLSDTDNADVTMLKAKLRTLAEVTIVGCKSKHLAPSNIKREGLVFDLSVFESCENLVVRHCCARQIGGLGALKATLKVLDVDGPIPSLSVLFHLQHADLAAEPPWGRLNRLNVANATMTTVDRTVAVLPNLENLNLRGNAIVDTSNLSDLLRLTILDLAQNGLADPTVSSLALGNISILNLADNAISLLKPLSRLLGLVTLNLNNNKVTDVDEVAHLDKLPMLQSVDFSYNPICADADYRSQVLGRFPNRIHEIMLDGIIPSADELAMAKVISALRLAKSSSAVETKSSAGRSFNLQTDFIL